MKYAKPGCENTKPTPYGNHAEPLSDNGFTPLPADGKAVKLRDWRHFVMPSDEEERATYVYAGTINAGNITAGTLSVDRMPQLGQANTTIFNNSVTRNGTAASVTTSFSGVKSGAKFVAILSIGGNAGNVSSPYGRVTPTGSSVSLNSSSYRDISFKEGGTTTREFYVMLSTGSVTATSGTVGFTIQLRGNDSGGGYTYGTLSALILSG